MSRHPRLRRLRVSDVQFHAAERSQLTDGFVGFASFVVDGALRLDSVSVRRSLRGDLYLSYPRRLDRAGREHHYFFPVTDVARLEIDRQVLAELRLREVIR